MAKAGKSGNLRVFKRLILMLSQQQLEALVSENETLRVQLNDLNYMVSLREEELALLKEEAAAAAELRSLLAVELDAQQKMQDHLGKQQRQYNGAVEREQELEQELTDAVRLLQQYNELAQQYNHTHAQLSDVQDQLAEMNKRNLLLEQIAGRIGEMESMLANIQMERDVLRDKITILENNSNQADL